MMRGLRRIKRRIAGAVGIVMPGLRCAWCYLRGADVRSDLPDGAIDPLIEDADQVLVFRRVGQRWTFDDVFRVWPVSKGLRP